jgi:hypothetical protein
VSPIAPFSDQKTAPLIDQRHIDINELARAKTRCEIFADFHSRRSAEILKRRSANLLLDSLAPNFQFEPFFFRATKLHLDFGEHRSSAPKFRRIAFVKIGVGEQQRLEPGLCRGAPPFFMAAYTAFY